MQSTTSFAADRDAFYGHRGNPPPSAGLADAVMSAHGASWSSLPEDLTVRILQTAFRQSGRAVFAMAVDESSL